MFFSTYIYLSKHKYNKTYIVPDKTTQVKNAQKNDQKQNKTKFRIDAKIKNILQYTPVQAIKLVCRYLGLAYQNHSHDDGLCIITLPSTCAAQTSQ